jgi:hypothetical protein
MQSQAETTKELSEKKKMKKNEAQVKKLRIYFPLAGSRLFSGSLAVQLTAE